MILTMSIENSNLTLGVFREDDLLFCSRMATDRKKTGDEYAIGFRSILELYGLCPEDITGCILSSVVPALTLEVSRALTLLLGRTPMVVGPGVKTGLNIRMDNPSALGSDLVVNAVAAAAAYPLPLIVMDLDTALTLMAVDEKGSYVGSVIAPGPAVSVTALAAACDQLPVVALEAPREVIGKNTVDCMKSGAVFGAAAMVDGLVSRMEAQLGTSCTLVATGILSETIVPHCVRQPVIDRDLTMKGLLRIYRRNQKK